MKGCLDNLFKALTVFAIYIVFGSIIGMLMTDESCFGKKEIKQSYTKQERLEINQCQNKFRATSSNAAFFSAPLTAFTAYMIFRKKSKT